MQAMAATLAKSMEARKVYLENKLKQQAIAKTGEIELPVDMQRVIFLPRIPGLFALNPGIRGNKICYYRV